MSTFAEMVDQIDSLSKEEIVEMKRIIERKWISLKQQEILDAVEQAKKDKAEGKTIVLSSPEEIKEYFAKILEDAD
jgi:hypothetical protein